MKLLRIVNQKGEFSTNGVDFSLITEINGLKAYSLLSQVIYNDCTFNENIDDIVNPAEKLVYREILGKLKELVLSKDSIISQVNNEFKEIDEKYLKEDDGNA